MRERAKMTPRFPASRKSATLCTLLHGAAPMYVFFEEDGGFKVGTILALTMAE